MLYFVYIAQSANHSLYTGYTNNVEERIRTHNSGKYGAKALRGKLPVRLVYSEEFESKSDALKREAEIKKLTRAEKLELVSRG